MDAYINFIFAHTYRGTTFRDTQLHPANYDWDTLKNATLNGPTIRPIRREWPRYTSVGCYPLFYFTKDNGVLCPKCANKNLRLTLDKSDPQWFITAADINYEDADLYCDNCSERIESAYAEEEHR